MIGEKCYSTPAKTSDHLVGVSVSVRVRVRVRVRVGVRVRVWPPLLVEEVALVTRQRRADSHLVIGRRDYARGRPDRGLG